MDWKQLFTVGDSQSPSASQLWFHLMNLAVFIAYIFITYKVGLLIVATTADIPKLIDSFVFFTGVVSGIVTSNKVANLIINLKSGNKDAATPK